MNELDVRGLPPPEPFEQIMAALEESDTVLRVLIHRQPFPLYDALRDQGYLWETCEMADGNFEILIRR